MEYTIENNHLKLTVTTWGAQAKSVVRKSDGVEHIWQGDPEVWSYHSPILFPHCGKMVEGKFEAKGKIYTTGHHGFARYMQHTLVKQTEDSIVMELCSNKKTLKKFPYEFRLLSSFRLEKDSVIHTLTVENLDHDRLPFGIGFHPAFNVPFDENHAPTDYELRFSEMESPVCLNTMPQGLLHGNLYLMPPNIEKIPISEDLFTYGSHCMINLKSKKLGLFEKGTGRGVVCDIEAFPYTQIWSKPGVPQFVCIEPWHSLPSAEGDSIKWEDKPAAAVLEPGRSWSCTLRTSFVR